MKGRELGDKIAALNAEVRAMVGTLGQNLLPTQTLFVATGEVGWGS